MVVDTFHHLPLSLVGLAVVETEQIVNRTLQAPLEMATPRIPRHLRGTMVAQGHLLLGLLGEVAAAHLQLAGRRVAQPLAMAATERHHRSAAPQSHTLAGVAVGLGQTLPMKAPAGQGVAVLEVSKARLRLAVIRTRVGVVEAVLEFRQETHAMRLVAAQALSSLNTKYLHNLYLYSNPHRHGLVLQA